MSPSSKFLSEQNQYRLNVMQTIWTCLDILFIFRNPFTEVKFPKTKYIDMALPFAPLAWSVLTGEKQNYPITSYSIDFFCNLHSAKQGYREVKYLHAHSKNLLISASDSVTSSVAKKVYLASRSLHTALYAISAGSSALQLADELKKKASKFLGYAYGNHAHQVTTSEHKEERAISAPKTHP